jgi:hypothetical protein
MLPSVNARTHLLVVGRTMLRALVALPRQIVAVARAVGATSPHPHGWSRILGGVCVALVANVAAIVAVFALARAIYYPFWAAGAPREGLDRSWGGPSPLGATLVHWLVAAATIAITYGVILLMDRLAAIPRSRSAD